MKSFEFKRGADKKPRKKRRSIGKSISKFILNNPRKVEKGIVMLLPRKKTKKKRLTVGDIRRTLNG